MKENTRVAVKLVISLRIHKNIVDCINNNYPLILHNNNFIKNYSSY